MTPIADMVEAMLAQNVSAGLIVLAVRAAEMSRNVPDMSRTDSAEYERERKRAWRNKSRKIKQMAEANDAAITPNDVPECPGHVPERCNLSSLLSKEEFEESSKEESKKEVVARARGTRLAVTELPDDWRAFAVGHGVADPAAAFAEFRDYWIAVPGQRGTKLDWAATWRNRIRNLPKNRGSNAKPPNGLAGALARLRDDIAADERSEERGRPALRLLPGGGRERP
jgi:hypothetical protein